MLSFSLISNALGLARFLLSVANDYGGSQQSHRELGSLKERSGKATEQKTAGRAVYEQANTTYQITLI